MNTITLLRRSTSQVRNGRIAATAVLSFMPLASSFGHHRPLTKNSTGDSIAPRTTKACTLYPKYKARYPGKGSNAEITSTRILPPSLSESVRNWIFKGNNVFRFLFVSVFICCLSACNFPTGHADTKFGTQNFVSAISVIELHKVRNGAYPQALSDLEFLGDWDGIWLSAVRYEKNGDGYNLYVDRGWVSEPDLSLPEKFKKGLGIKKTNVKWISH